MMNKGISFEKLIKHDAIFLSIFSNTLKKYYKFTDKRIFMIEKRNFQRIELPGILKYNIKKSDIKDLADIVNISERGLCIFSEERITIGDDISMEISSPLGNSPISIDGKIIYSKEENSNFRVGVKFNKELVSK